MLKKINKKTVVYLLCLVASLVGSNTWASKKKRSPLKNSNNNSRESFKAQSNQTNNRGSMNNICPQCFYLHQENFKLNRKKQEMEEKYQMLWGYFLQYKSEVEYYQKAAKDFIQSVQPRLKRGVNSQQNQSNQEAQGYRGQQQSNYPYNYIYPDQYMQQQAQHNQHVQKNQYTQHSHYGQPNQYMQNNPFVQQQNQYAQHHQYTQQNQYVRPSQYTQNNQFVQQQQQAQTQQLLPQPPTFAQRSAQVQQNPYSQNNPFGQNNQHPQNQPNNQSFFFNPQQLPDVYTSSESRGIPRQSASLNVPTDTKTDADNKVNTDSSNPNLLKTGIRNAISPKSKVPNMSSELFKHLSPEKDNENNNNNRSFSLSVNNSSIGNPLPVLFQGPSPGVLKVRKSIVIADNITEQQCNSAPMTLLKPISNKNNNEKKDENEEAIIDVD